MARNMREEAEKRARCEARGEKYGERQYECIVRKKFRERVSSWNCEIDNVKMATADEAAHADDEHEDGSHGGHEVYAVLMPWFVQALGIVVFFILTRHVHGLPCECYLLSCKRFL